MRPLLQLFILLYSVAVLKADSSCKELSECRLDLLARRFACIEQPRKAVERICRLKEDLRIVWKAFIRKEKWVSQCLLNEMAPAVTNRFCFHAQPIGLDSLGKCGLSLKLLEERCNLLKSCCSVAERCLQQAEHETVANNLKQRTKFAVEKSTGCNRKVYAAIQTNMTADDIAIARSIVRRTTSIRELLLSLVQTQPATPFAPFPPEAPVFARKEVKNVENRVLGSRIIQVDRQSGSPAAKDERKTVIRRPSSAIQSETATLRKLFVPKPNLRNRKAKTLFTQLLHKRRGTMKPWREARTRSIPSQILPNLSGYRLNMSRGNGTDNHPVSTIHFKEESWKRKVKDLKPLYQDRKTTETTLKPVYLKMKFVDGRTRNKWKKVDWYREKSEEKSISEEDFEAEFEKKVGSLVSFGPNALPLPGSKKHSHIDDPFQGIVERQELYPADLSDITTRAPYLRPRLQPPVFEQPRLLQEFAKTTPIPLQTASNTLWEPLLSFFTTPDPFYFSTAFPLRLWPIRKAHGVTNFQNTTEEESEVVTPENPVAISVTNTTEAPLDKSYCVRYQTCLRVLEETERECEVKKKPGPKIRKRQSVCFSLEKKFEILNLVKTIETEYRRCVWNYSEGYSLENDPCSDLPTLPADFYMIKSCTDKTTRLQKHCEVVSQCCSSAESCKTATSLSNSVSELKKKKRRMEAMKARCEQKKRKEVEGVAQLERQ